MVPVPTDPKNGFKLDMGVLKSKITPKTKMMILNHPCNPTGMVLDKSELEAIAKIAIEHDILVISDEIYEKILFDGRKFTSMASIEGMKERTILINGFSKSYSMTGLRIAYIAANSKLVSNIVKFQQHSATCATSVSQFMALEALRGPQDFIPKLNNVYEERRNYFDKKVKALPGASWVFPQGTFYGMLETKFAKTSVEASARLLDEFQLATVPGSAFGDSGEGYVRVCLTIETPIIDEVFDLLKKL